MRTNVIVGLGVAATFVALWIGARQLDPPSSETRPQGAPVPASGTAQSTPATQPTQAAPTATNPTPPQPVAPLDPLQRSMALEQQGDLEGAAKAAAEAVVADDGRDPRLQAGKIAILRKRLDEAEVWLRPLAEADPTDVTVRFDLALVAYHRGQLDQARAEYEAVLQLDPTHANARFNLALMLRDAGDLEGARQQLGVLHELHPDDPRPDRVLQSLDGDGAARP